MAYLKDELQGFVPVEQATEIMKDVARGSSLLRLSKVTEMTSDTKKNTSYGRRTRSILGRRRRKNKNL